MFNWRVVQLLYFTFGLIVILLLYKNKEWIGIQDTDTQDRKQHFERFGSNNNNNNGTTAGTCTTSERLQMIHNFCKTTVPYKDYHKSFLQLRSNQKTAPNAVDDILDLIPDKHIVELAHELWMDPVNKVIVCMHAKAGCSTWKTLLANNTGIVPMKADFKGSIHSEILKRGMKCVDEGLDAAEIRDRLRTWYKIVIVRHPFDRLVSAYNEKLAGDNKIYMRYIGNIILEKYHPDLPSKVKQQGKGVQFQDFIQFLVNGARDDHWNGPYEAKCHACILNYDYVVKLETQSKDSEFIVNKKLKGRGLGVTVNPKRELGATFLKKGRDLSKYFGNLTGMQYNNIYNKYYPDLAMYGYRMDNTSYTAHCDGEGKDGTGCC